jgi:hypothetical protein
LLVGSSSSRRLRRLETRDAQRQLGLPARQRAGVLVDLSPVPITPTMARRSVSAGSGTCSRWCSSQVRHGGRVDAECDATPPRSVRLRVRSAIWTAWQSTTPRGLATSAQDKRSSRARESSLGAKATWAPSSRPLQPPMSMPATVADRLTLQPRHALWFVADSPVTQTGPASAGAEARHR